MPQPNYRYQFPKKAIKADCPQCGPKHRKTLSCYVDTRTGEVLPKEYGRCDRESNCNYHFSPYQKTASGMSYADEVYQQWKENNPLPARQNTAQTAPRQSEPPKPVYTIPDEVFIKSLGHYERNQFARLLRAHVGVNLADDLLQQFYVGTSSRWPGACVFWYIDEQGRKRGGQIKLFGNDWHTVKYEHEGKQYSKTSWVHTAYARHCDRLNQPYPDWLKEYEEKAERSPCLFGLPQLFTAAIDTPVAIVEAPKTAILCTHYLKGFVWLAVGALSYLNAERLAPLRGRKVVLFPDLNAYADWSRRADLLRTKGFQVEVSGLLEQAASNESKAKGLDLADFLLNQNQPLTVRTIAEWTENPGSILRPFESQLERLIVEPCDYYPAEWEE